VREVARLLRSSGKVARVAKVREGKEGIRESGFGRRDQKIEKESLRAEPIETHYTILPLL